MMTEKRSISHFKTVLRENGYFAGRHSDNRGTKAGVFAAQLSNSLPNFTAKEFFLCRHNALVVYPER